MLISFTLSLPDSSSLGPMIKSHLHSMIGPLFHPTQLDTPITVIWLISIFSNIVTLFALLMCPSFICISTIFHLPLVTVDGFTYQRCTSSLSFSSLLFSLLFIASVTYWLSTKYLFSTSFISVIKKISNLLHIPTQTLTHTHYSLTLIPLRHFATLALSFLCSFCSLSIELSFNWLRVLVHLFINWTVQATSMNIKYHWLILEETKIHWITFIIHSLKHKYTDRDKCMKQHVALNTFTH